MPGSTGRSARVTISISNSSRRWSRHLPSAATCRPAKFEDYKTQLPSGAHATYVASNGPYDFLGTKYFRESEGNRFDRLRVMQGGKTFEFVQNDYPYATPIEGQQVTGLFALPPMPASTRSSRGDWKF